MIQAITYSPPSFITTRIGKVTLTSSQVKSLRATPITIIAAPGSGKYIFPVSFSLELVYGGNNAFTTTGSGSASLAIRHIGGNGLLLSFNNAFLELTSSTSIFRTDITSGGGYAQFSKTGADNIGIEIANIDVSEYAGNAANNNTLTVKVFYQILEFG